MPRNSKTPYLKLFIDVKAYAAAHNLSKEECSRLRALYIETAKEEFKLGNKSILSWMQKAVAKFTK